MLCVLYCAIILIAVVVKLREVSYQLVDTNIGGNTMTSQYGKNVLKRKAIVSSVVKRIIWYPVVPLVVQGPGFLYETQIYVTHVTSFALGLISVLGTAEGN